MGAVTKEELGQVLTEAGHRHHQAYSRSDGVDPEWPKWYAAFIQATVWDRFGDVPTQSELIQLLVAADKAHRTTAPTDPWPPFYAEFILSNI